MRTVFLGLAGGMLAMAGCHKSPGDEAPRSEETSTQLGPAAEERVGEPGAPGSHHELPQGHPPIQGGPGSAPMPPGSGRLEQIAGGLTWMAPLPFEQRQPTAPMRAAEYVVRDAPDATLTVYFFGTGQGGSVEANVQRWLGQFHAPNGAKIAQRTTTTERDVRGMKAHLVRAQGTYQGMQMPGAPPQPAGEDYRLLGAIVEGPMGPVFFKLVGPSAAIERVEGPFDELVSSIRVM